LGVLGVLRHCSLPTTSFPSFLLQFKVLLNQSSFLNSKSLGWVPLKAAAELATEGGLVLQGQSWRTHMVGEFLCEIRGKFYRTSLVRWEVEREGPVDKDRN
jgi:hypothetical protein